eukprot:SAG11_NODE_108_length_16386_cov_20.828329_5_plen_173_part_00
MHGSVPMASRCHGIRRGNARNYAPDSMGRTKYWTKYALLPIDELDLPPQSKIHDVFHVALLKPVHGFDTGRGIKEQLPNHQGEQEYAVEAITAQRVRNGEKQYLVKWEGYMCEDSTWEPLHHLKNCPDKLRDFKVRLRKEDGRSRHDIVETLEQYEQSGIDHQGPKCKHAPH